MLYIMRHGKTDWNTRFQLQGRTDIHLNEEGRQMAIAAHDEYKDVHFDVCYCSPLERAQETAKLLLKDRNVPIITDNRLIEMCFGEYEGQEQVLQHPELPIYKFFTEPENFIADRGCETLEELFSRTGNFLKEVVHKDLAEGKDVLIVGHGAMNNSIICQERKLPIKDFWKTGIPNCKLITV